MAQINNKFTSYWIDTTTAPGTPITGLSATITIREASPPYSIVVNNQPMSEVGNGWYIYEYAGYNSTIDYLYHCNPNNSAAFIESGVTSQSIWNDDIVINSNIIGSFGEKFSQYGGVSHVIDRSSLDEESKKEIKAITDKLEEVNTSLKIAPKIETKYIESTREIVRVEKVPVPQSDNKALANIIIKGLKELSKTLSTIMVKGLLEIKNNK